MSTNYFFLFDLCSLVSENTSRSSFCSFSAPQTRAETSFFFLFQAVKKQVTYLVALKSQVFLL